MVGDCFVHHLQDHVVGVPVHGWAMSLGYDLLVDLGVFCHEEGRRTVFLFPLVVDLCEFLVVGGVEGNWAVAGCPGVRFLCCWPGSVIRRFWLSLWRLWAVGCGGAGLEAGYSVGEGRVGCGVVVYNFVETGALFVGVAH